MEFTALRNFSCPELKSDYVAGLGYTARDPKDAGIQGDGRDVKLAREKRALLLKLLPQWVKEGKIVLGRPVPGAAGTVRGGGKVS